jgi:hypothetical protein
MGFLTSAELAMLGKRFERYFPVARDTMFDDLLAQLDLVEATPLGSGVSIQTRADRSKS